MKTFTSEELKEVLKLHKMWLNGKMDGVRANLSGANLTCANLTYANLTGANLSGANLAGTNLTGANLTRANLTCANLNRAYLSGANLAGANLAGTNLTGAYLTRANLTCANLNRANLSGADLSGANLSGADLSGAYLSGAYLSGATLPDLEIKLESDDFVAYKKVVDKNGDEVILALLVPKEALKTSSLVGRKCRASHLKVVSAQYCGSDQTCEETEFYSKHDRNFIYKIGEMAEVVDFDPDIRIECTKGLHFFVTKQEAVEY